MTTMTTILAARFTLFNTEHVLDVCLKEDGRWLMIQAWSGVIEDGFEIWDGSIDDYLDAIESMKMYFIDLDIDLVMAGKTKKPWQVAKTLNNRLKPWM